MDTSTLSDVANRMVAPGKGILAADESTGTIGSRLLSIGLENTEDNRRSWREILFTTPGIEEQISGVILYDETIRQNGSDGKRLIDNLTSLGIMPGIKVDKSTSPLENAPGELFTSGLDGLRDRLAEYRNLGATFAKWRAVITVAHGIPTARGIKVNSEALARYAGLCQEAGIVPIVEPEVLMDGDHTIEKCYAATEATLSQVFSDLIDSGVYLEGIVLKPNMVLSGSDAPNRADAAEVAERTITCFRRTVPAAVPGIAFLSGGQGDEEATVNLDAMNRSELDRPWNMTFSYGRGLQAAPLKKWGQDTSDITGTQEVFARRAKIVAAASRGEYSADMERG
ncbi:MAG: fructose-bisphosphate aldolase class I [Chloroflexi bacterium]|nr:fructose-bisphosphate aldolase class I [Chloroflexota bacterium]